MERFVALICRACQNWNACYLSTPPPPFQVQLLTMPNWVAQVTNMIYLVIFICQHWNACYLFTPPPFQVQPRQAIVG